MKLICNAKDNFNLKTCRSIELKYLLTLLAITILISIISLSHQSELTLTDLLDNTNSSFSELDKKKHKNILSLKAKSSHNDNKLISYISPDIPLLNNYRNDNNQLNEMLIQENKPFLFQSWINYFHYSNKSSLPNKFYINTKFGDTIESRSSLKGDKDEYGTFTIPNKHSFFASLQDDKLNIMESRLQGMTSYIDVLNIELIERIPDDDFFKGGIKNYGLVKEGYCFKVTTYVPNDYFTMTLLQPDAKEINSVKESWIICLESKELKDKMMLWLIKLKLNLQNKVGYHLYSKQQGNSSKTNLNNISDTKIDGHWEIIKNWGECSVVCGGGLQHQQLICVPPKNGGKPCLGDTMRTRPCNIQPCPSKIPETQKNTINVNTPVVKVLPLSNKPLNYELCKIKESDCLMVVKKSSKDDKNAYNTKIDLIGNTSNIQIPVRLIMNKNSIIVVDLGKLNLYHYSDIDNINKSKNLPTIQSYNINKTDINVLDAKVISSNNYYNHQCFELISYTTKAIFCSLNKSNTENNESNMKLGFSISWKKDFQLFKYACNNNKKASEIEIDTSKIDLVDSGLSEKENQELKDLYKSRLNSTRQEIIKLRERNLKQKIEEVERNSLQNKLQKKTLQSLEYYNKEYKYENILQSEEQRKEEEEIAKIKKEIEEENKKKALLLTKIKQKKKDEEADLFKYHITSKFKEIEDETKMKIIQKREELKKKILLMRRRNERRKQMLKNQLKMIRGEITQEIIAVTKKENYSVCVEEKNQNKDFTEKFCTVLMSSSNPKDEDNDINGITGKFGENKMSDCKNVETFCVTCCEIKIGEINVKDRDKCYDKCNKIKISKDEKSG